jgi:A/G-specific adenine glycosylase
MVFYKRLISWFYGYKRDLPWRNTRNPYKIWLSEVILQQTRVNQGMDYYLKFVEEFPTVRHLAEATEEKVLKLWQGLGYYSRARNLHNAAKYISYELDGIFPTSYHELLKLKGVGRYTAAAIASMAFDERVAVVDGNVFRVLSRIYGVKTPIDSSKGYSDFFDLANELMEDAPAGDFNQAIMEFGAIHCTPKQPNCKDCIFSDVCHAYKHNEVELYPSKKGRPR